MDDEIREIQSINFGIYSTEEIIAMSTCKIDNPKKSGHNSVYDLRMGAIENNQECETCNQNTESCPGHFGYIELNEPIIHPLFYRRVEAYLKCFCIKCYRLILQEDQIYLSELNKFKGETRFINILEKVKKTDICCHEDCQNEQPEFKYSPTENTISMVYQVKSKSKVNIVMTVDEIKKIFDNISAKDVELLGFDPKYSHPKNLIMCVLPVIPPCDRPYVKVDGHICDDDLTIQYIDIIKLNNSLLEDDLTETKKQKIMAGLKFRILTTFNNSQGRAKQTTNSRPIKGIKERLTGKDGQLRNNMMGKRCCESNTPILLWNGKTKKASELVIGDIIIGDDGNKRTITDIFSGKDQMYKVIQGRGDSYIVNSQHILTLRFNKHKHICFSNTRGWIIKWFDKNEIRMKTKSFGEDYKSLEKFSKCINDSDIFDISIQDYLKLNKTTQNSFLGIKLSTCINWEHKNVNIDPYLLGLSLGNEKYKYIPSEFIINHKNIRLKLLAGLIDNIALIEENGKIVRFSQLNENIIEKVDFISKSLGFSTRIEDSILTIYGHGLEEIPTKLKHLSSSKNMNSYWIKIENVGIGNFTGFEIDNNKRFLLADFTITHNCEQTARTVIGPEPTLKLNQVAIPKEVAETLTVPVRVANFNIKQLTEIVNSGKANYVLKNGGKTRINLEKAIFKSGTKLLGGDIIIRNGKEIQVKSGREILQKGDQIKRDGKLLEKVEYPSKREYKLEIGDIVERQLQDYDWVLLNPTF